jgi:hypothetical protein
MKMFIIALVVIILLMVLIQSFTIMPINKTEEQKHSVVRKYKDFEIRFHPSATFATSNWDAKTYSELSGPGFQKLAEFIFGSYILQIVK